LAFSPAEILNGRQQKGGETTVRITCPFGNNWKTVVVCSNKDNFSRKTAVKMALERLENDTVFLTRVINSMMKAHNIGIGYWSTQAAERWGYCRYKTPGGKIVNVTCVNDTIDWDGYKWADKEIVGFVVYNGGYIDRPSRGTWG
jgi:hypothetical protein